MSASLFCYWWLCSVPCFLGGVALVAASLIIVFFKVSSSRGGPDSQPPRGSSDGSRSPAPSPGWGVGGGSSSAVLSGCHPKSPDWILFSPFTGNLFFQPSCEHLIPIWNPVLLPVAQRVSIIRSLPDPGKKGEMRAFRARGSTPATWENCKKEKFVSIWDLWLPMQNRKVKGSRIQNYPNVANIVGPEVKDRA